MLPQNNSGRVIPVAEWDELYESGNHAVLSYQFLNYIYRFGQAAAVASGYESRIHLTDFLRKFAGYILQPAFTIPESDIRIYIHLNATLAYLAASTDYVSTDRWLELLDREGAPARKKLVLYSLRNRYRPRVKGLFDEEPVLASLWYARQFIACNLPASRWMLDNARDLYAQFPDNYRIVSPNCVLAGYFAITYIDPENEAPFKIKLNRAIRRCQPVIQANGTSRKKSIAVVTRRWFRTSAVYRALYPYLKSLADEYELTLVNLAKPGVRVEADLFVSVKYFSPLQDPGKLSDEQRQIIEDQDWGVVYYPDIGMDVETLYLANLRLAPLQIMGYGHPASTHGSEIDYFIAGQETELAEHAHKYFSERLVLLPGMGMIPVWPEKEFERKIPNMNRSEVIVNCPWTLLKINADIVELLRDVAAQCGKRVRFRFYSGHDVEEMGAHQVYLRELCELLDVDSVELYGLMNYREFLSRMSGGDLTIVAYPFGGFNTIIDSLYVGVPVVAREGVHGFNRFSTALLRRAGFPDLVAVDEAGFREIILRLITDRDYRQTIASRIRAGGIQERVTGGLDPVAFKRALDYLVEYHATIRKDDMQQPIVIN